MISAFSSRLRNPASTPECVSYCSFFGGHRPLRPLYNLRLPDRWFSPLAVGSECNSPASSPFSSEAPPDRSISSHLTSSVESPPIQTSQWSLTQRHVVVLNFVACAVAVSTTWLFFSAIPALLAFKRAAESLEKLMDVTREELPDTMAAIRLSGMEISDLTMELSNLGQDITQGVRSSTRAVRLAEERLRRLTNMVPGAAASMQELEEPKSTERTRAAVARSARSLREGIGKGRAVWQAFFTLARFLRFAFNYYARRAKG